MKKTPAKPSLIERLKSRQKVKFALSFLDRLEPNIASEVITVIRAFARGEFGKSRMFGRGSIADALSEELGVRITKANVSTVLDRIKRGEL